MTIKVRMRKIKKASEITNLQINQKEFILEVEGKYYLDFKMPLPILKEEGDAKWDKKKRTLSVKIMVDV